MPRSASRDLADRFLDPVTGRRRRYFRTWNQLERWKMYLAIFAALIVAGWAVGSKSPKFDYQASHGPVANVHAAWDSQCEACHRDAMNAGTLDAHARWHDFTCEKCHAAPPHSAMIDSGDAVENCGSCHHDHGGRNNSLVKLSDEHCVRCHQTDIAMAKTVHRQASTSPASHFATDHPEFRSLENHKRHLKFSHSLHMTPGIVLASGAKNTTMKDSKPVQLECNSCHTLETNPATRAAGKYFQPIDYETNCKSCHPTTVPPTVTNRGTVVQQFNIPHRIQNIELIELMEKEYSLRLQENHPALAQKPTSAPAIASFKEEVVATSRKAIESIWKVNCLKCHDTYRSAGLNLDFSVGDPKIPTIWMKSAKFDHTAHKATACLDCHPSAVSEIKDGLTVVNEREPVNIKGLASCRECHSPQGKITSNCTDCHGFHNGEHPLEGRGADAYFPKPMTIQDFLKGK